MLTLSMGALLVEGFNTQYIGTGDAYGGVHSIGYKNTAGCVFMLV